MHTVDLDMIECQMSEVLVLKSPFPLGTQCLCREVTSNWWLGQCIAREAKVGEGGVRPGGQTDGVGTLSGELEAQPHHRTDSLDSGVLAAGPGGKFGCHCGRRLLRLAVRDGLHFDLAQLLLPFIAF